MKPICLFAAVALLTANAGLAFAQDAPAGNASGMGDMNGMGNMGGMAMRGHGRMAACRDDMQKFCAGKQGPDRRQCMQDNKDKFSDGCKAALAARHGGANAPAGSGQ